MVAPSGARRAQILMRMRSLNATVYVDGFSFAIA
jgi:hypothetical protein